MKHRIAIFASGTGSNAENLARHFQMSEVAEVALLLTDREAPVTDRLRPYGVPSRLIPRKEWRENPSAVVEVLEEARIDFIVLAGFLTVVPQEVIGKYHGRIVNVHPSLLPKYGGKGMWDMNVHRAVIAGGETESGITVHFVDNGVDTGKTIAQFRCQVEPGTSPEDLAQKIHELEQHHLPTVVEECIKGFICNS